MSATGENDDPDDVTDGGKKAYEPPRVLSREPLEAIAVGCSPSPPAKGNPGVCPTGPISS